MATISSQEFFKSGGVKVIGNEQSVQEDESNNGASFFGELARGVVRPLAKIGTSVVNIGQTIAGKELTQPFSGKYLGEVGRVGEGFDATKGLTKENISAIEDAAKVGFDVGAMIPVSAGAKIATGAIKQTAKDVGGNVVSGVGNIAQKGKTAIIDSLSGKIDTATEKILKATPRKTFDRVVKLAEESVNDLEKPSTYEHVAQSMTKATKQLAGQVKSLSEQKANIIAKAKYGLQDFTKETNQTILEINRKLKDSPIAKTFIGELKNVKNKQQADSVIDKLQDIIYKANKDMTIPVGSAEDKILRGVLGKYNTSLKNGLPEAYRALNDKLSNRIKALTTLNRSLGEVVNGVPIRGAGLVKQFFSPAGTKTKQLFDYIKKTTGVDLAQDAVLAKYIGNIFGDTKTRTLLEGVPTTASGAINEAINFTLEKIGVRDALKNAKIKSSIKKARRITKPISE
jgi:hypothetical protein